MTSSLFESSSDWSRLMAAAQVGEMASYSTLLKAAAPLLREIARRHLDGESEVETAVQQSLVTVHRLRHTYDPQRSCAAWIAAIGECEAERLASLAEGAPARNRRDGLIGFGVGRDAPFHWRV